MVVLGSKLQDFSLRIGLLIPPDLMVPLLPEIAAILDPIWRLGRLSLGDFSGRKLGHLARPKYLLEQREHRASVFLAQS